VEVKLKEVSIEITNRCLMRCIHCSSGSAPKAGKDELTPSEVASVILDGAELGAYELSFSGGDPILQPEHLLAYVDTALHAGYSRIMVYTTGVTELHDWSAHQGISTMWLSRLAHLSDDVKERVVLIYSLHSHRPEVHDYIMGQAGAWNAIVGNIEQCVEYGFKVEVHMVPMLPNYKHVKKMADFCGQLGVRKLSLLRFVPQTRGRANNDQLALNHAQFRDLQRVMQDTTHDTEMPVDVRFGCPIDFRHTLYDSFDQKQHQCHAGLDLILVRPSGEVHPCAAWKSLPGMDNVRDKPLADIWAEGKVFKALREFHDEDWDMVRGQCKACKYARTCRSGCPAQRLHAIKLAEPSHRPTIQDLYYPEPDPLCPLGG
jgi:radical SAM protein with 4Fe4S-binding SPASM domain